MNPKISVIIPAYNTEAYIEIAINSVLNQTFTDLEIIVIDDASTDSTYQVVKGIQDHRIQLIRSEENLGAGGARNLALSLAKGDWVAVLDSDDWYDPDRLNQLLKMAEANDADMVADDIYLINEGEVNPWSTLMQWSEKSLENLFHIDAVFFALDNVEGKSGMFLGYSKPMFRRNFLVEHNIKYLSTIKIAEDFWLDMECLVKGAKFILLSQPYYYYRTRQGALTTSTKRVLRLSQECETIKLFISQQDEYLQSNPQLNKALEYKYRETKKYLDYYQVVEPLKDKQFLKAVLALPKSPGFFTSLFSQTSKALKRYLQSFYLKKKNVYGKFSY